MEVGNDVVTTVVSDMEPGRYGILFEIINRDIVLIVNRNVNKDSTIRLVVPELHFKY